MAIKRDEVKSKREALLVKIKELEESVKKTRFTTNRYYDGYGLVEGMDKLTLASAFKDLKSRMASDVMSELGFTKNDDEEETYLGFTLKEWMDDFMTRAQQIRDEEKIEKLQDAVAILEDNLSEDDRFELDMEAVEDLCK
jgi:hypothetical protein